MKCLHRKATDMCWSVVEFKEHGSAEWMVFGVENWDYVLNGHINAANHLFRTHKRLKTIAIYAHGQLKENDA